MRQGEIETANRVGVDEGEGREEAGVAKRGDYRGRFGWEGANKREREEKRKRKRARENERAMRERFNQTNAYK